MLRKSTVTAFTKSPQRKLKRLQTTGNFLQREKLTTLEKSKPKESESSASVHAKRKNFRGSLMRRQTNFALSVAESSTLSDSIDTVLEERVTSLGDNLEQINENNTKAGKVFSYVCFDAYRNKTRSIYAFAHCFADL